MSQETSEWLNQNVLIGFADQRGKAWHYRASSQGAEPNHYPGAVPVGDVKRRLFGWTAEERPIAVVHPADIEHMTGLDAGGNPVRYALIPDRKAIVASDNDDVLGVFKSGYTPHQFEQWLVENVEHLLDDDLSIESAGLLKNRAVAWVQVGVPDTIMTPEGVAFRPHLLAATSLDGSLSTTYKRTVTNVVCDNTMGSALQERGHQVKFRHSKNSIGKIADARMALDIVHTLADDFAREVEVLCNTAVSDEQWRKIVEELVPLDPDSKRATTIATDKRAKLDSMYRNDLRVAPWSGTAFGVVQAFSTFGQHEAPMRGDTIRAERNMWQTLDGTIERQDRQVLALVGAGVGQSFGPDASMGLSAGLS